ncbi:hypothetical protein Tco_0862434 [Tanacetum coccineum]
MFNVEDTFTDKSSDWRIPENKLPCAYGSFGSLSRHKRFLVYIKLLIKVLDRKNIRCKEFMNAPMIRAHPSVRKGGCYEVYDIEDLVKVGEMVQGGLGCMKDYQVYLGKYELGDEHRKRWNEIKDVTTKQETGFSYNESLYAGETYKSAERWLNKTNDHANVFGGSFKWFSRILDDSGEVMSISLQLKLDLSSSRVHHSSKRIFQGITPNKVAGRHSMDLG